MVRAGDGGIDCAVSFIDLTFLSANLLKVFDGGWMPLALGAVVMTIMYTWRRGTAVLYRRRAEPRRRFNPCYRV
jgi:K+ transporter